jgi:hypothetical protein
VPTGADLVVEGAIYFVGFGAEDAGEVVGHFEGGGVVGGEFGGEKWRLKVCAG